MHPLGQHQRFLDVVGDQQNGEAGALPELQQEVLHRFADLEIQSPEGFIQQQDAGVGGQGAGDGHPLLHAAGQFTGQLVGGFAEAHHFEEVGRAFADLRRLHPLQPHAEGHVFGGVQPRVKAVFLKHHAPIRTGAAHGLPVDADAAAAGVFQAGDQAQDRAFAGARTPHQGHELPGLHGQRQAIEDQLLAESLAEVVDDQFHGSDRPLAAEPQQQPESHVDGETDQAEHDQFSEDLVGAEEALGQLNALAEADFRSHQFGHHHQIP